MTFFWHNGDWQEDDAPAFGIHDRMRLGECVFGTILCINGKLVKSKAHLDKLRNHAAVLGLPIPYNDDELMTHAEALLQKNGFGQERCALNIIVTGGQGGNGLKLPEQRKPKILIRALPVPDQFPDIHAIIAQTVRRNEGSPLSQIKCTYYAEHILALKEAQESGANDAILLNNAGAVTCSSVASVFLLKEGHLYTPPLSDGVQSGVTRKALITHLNVIEKTIRPDELLSADGLWFANSLRGVMPVHSLNGQEMPRPEGIIPEGFHINEVYS